MSRKLLRRLLVVSALLVAIAALQGCSYAKYRARDAAEMMDFGMTFSKKPQFAFYMNCPTVIPLGWGKVDATFVGVGEGKAGLQEKSYDEAGMLFWGREKNSWGDFDESTADVVCVEDVGVVGLAISDKAKKKPMCVHHFHFGWFGFVWDVRYVEIADFFVGIVGLDLSGDDGPDGGYWFGRKKEAEIAQPVATTSDNPALSALKVSDERTVR